MLLNFYEPTERNFSRNGHGFLKNVSSAKITQELNGTYELLVKCNYDKRLAEDCVVKADGQLFRIYTINKLIAGTIEIKARHITYDLALFIAEDLNGNLTADEAMKQLAVENFSLSSDILDKSAELEITNVNVINAIFILAEAFEGELLRDNFNLKLTPKIGGLSPVRLMYAKNLRNMNFELNIDEVATVVKPICRDKDNNTIELPEKYVKSPLVNNYFSPKYKVVEFSDIRRGSDDYPTSEMVYEEMRNRVMSMFEEGLDKPKLNAKIDAVNFYVNLGDIVNVYHSGIGVDIAARVVKTVWDCLKERYERIEIGNVKTNFADMITGNIVEITNNIQSSIDNIPIVKVINSLNSTATSEALSAAQGKYLNDIKIDSLKPNIQGTVTITNGQNSLAGIVIAAGLDEQPVFEIASMGTAVLRKNLSMENQASINVGTIFANSIVGNPLELQGAEIKQTVEYRTGNEVPNLRWVRSEMLDAIDKMVQLHQQEINEIRERLERIE